MDRDKKNENSGSTKIKALKVIGFLVGLIILIDLAADYKSRSRAPKLPTPQVSVAHPKSEPRTEYVTQTGNTVAFNSVDLVARIEGYLDTISFTDGSIVKKGQPLFIIEPDPYLQQLNAQKATLQAQEANLAYTKSEYARQQRMYKENATSLNNVESWLAKSQESAAEILKDKANVEIASINYSYTHVQAPFDGRIGRHLIDVGNLVGNGVATKLATIEQIDPLYVYFNLNELDLIKLRNAAREQGFKPNDIQKIPVEVRLQNETGFPHKGNLNFVNTGLNSSTGTLEFRALFPNKNYVLLPGLFVQVRIAVTKPKLQLTLPATAVQYDQIGAYVLTVDKDNKVVLQRVTVGSTENEAITITKGVQAQDKVIVSGLQNAVPGNVVDVRYQSHDR